MASEQIGSVTRIRHPRTDFPQFGWIQTAQPAPYDPSINDWHIDTVRTRARQYWTSDPLQQGWLDKVPAGLWESWFWPAIETGRDFSYRLPPEKDTKSRGDDVIAAWKVPSAVFDPPFMAGPDAQVRQRIRIPGTRYYTSDPPELSWVVPAEVFDPQLRPYASGDRAGREQGRTRPYQDQLDVQWLVPSVVFDPRLWPSIPILDRLVVPPPGRPRGDMLDVSWVFQNLPAVFDPSKQSWFIPADIMAGRKWWTGEQPRTEWIFQNLPLAFDPSKQSWVIYADAMARRKWWTGEQPHSEWIFQNLPIAFDPSKQSWLIPSDSIAGRKRWTGEQPRSEWIFQNLPATFDPSKNDWFVRGDMVRAPRYWTGVQPDTSWISTALVAFDPTLWVAAGSQASQHLWLLRKPYAIVDQPETSGWISSSLFDPSRLSWLVSDSRMPGRAGWTPVWVYHQNLGWVLVEVTPAQYLHLLSLMGVGM